MGYIDDPRNDPYTVQMANLRQTNQDVQNMVSDRQQQAGAAADGISADTALPTGLPDKLQSGTGMQMPATPQTPAPTFVTPAQQAPLPAQAQPGTPNQSAAESARLARQDLSSAPAPDNLTDARGIYERAQAKRQQGNPSAVIQDRFQQLQALNANVAQPTAAQQPTASANLMATPQAQAFAQAIYGGESSYGRANTSQPNTKGATGPMQMKASTFLGAVRMGLVPGLTEANANVNDPQQNLAVGQAYARYLYGKYNGDVNKAAAAYFAGEPAVDGGTNDLGAFGRITDCP